MNLKTLMEIFIKHGTDKDPKIVARSVTGLLVGISLAVKNPELARQIDMDLRRQWEDDQEKGSLYNPALIAESFIKILGNQQK